MKEVKTTTSLFSPSKPGFCPSTVFNSSNNLTGLTSNCSQPKQLPSKKHIFESFPHIKKQFFRQQEHPSHDPISQLPFLRSKDSTANQSTVTHNTKIGRT